jgi:hypothetical protein
MRAKLILGINRQCTAWLRVRNSLLMHSMGSMGDALLASAALHFDASGAALSPSGFAFELVI